jgi:hypothetical protein
MDTFVFTDELENSVLLPHSDTHLLQLAAEENPLFDFNVPEDDLSTFDFDVLLATGDAIGIQRSSRRRSRHYHRHFCFACPC